MILPAVTLPYAAGWAAGALEAIADTRKFNDPYTSDRLRFFAEVLFAARIAA